MEGMVENKVKNKKKIDYSKDMYRMTYEKKSTPKKKKKKKKKKKTKRNKAKL